MSRFVEIKKNKKIECGYFYKYPDGYYDMTH